jgi:K+ transporter
VGRHAKLDQCGVCERGRIMARGVYEAARTSVLSAVEGLGVVTPIFARDVLPITVVNFVGLFAVQSRGTASIAAVFGLPSDRDLELGRQIDL